jgi:hypothetical protein
VCRGCGLFSLLLSGVAVRCGPFSTDCWLRFKGVAPSSVLLCEVSRVRPPLVVLFA